MISDPVFPFLICLLPLFAIFTCMLILIKEFKFLSGIFSILIGLFAVIPIAAIQFAIEYYHLVSAHSLSQVLLKSLLINGVIEETIKMLLLFLISKKHSLSAFFACALLSGLALGCFESMVYLVSGIEHLGLRMLTAVVIHTACAGLSGLFVYSIKNESTKVLSFILAVILHGVYNYFAGFKMDNFFFWFSFVVVLVAVVECRIRYRALVPEGLILFQ
ncbi:PrsW family glutamic-type intramembrane protease [Treponema sp.]|uniref:PrsW family glutamic-type intramembrane protease n=1 Tax=Treponema sp. TaxID=166 RepID=UPI00298DAD7C|nr:PrsW family glutamic-type intramembrane protease [Treponema sp.]MCQ2241931.1 PrsW family glutamic-type intramembrane protease [Treponema sp.]